MKNRVLFIIALLIVAILAQPMYAATPKKSSKQKLPKLEKVDNKLYYAGKEEIKRKDLLEFYAKHNCEVAYKEYKKGRDCVIAGWVLFGAGTGMAVTGLGCIIGGVVGAVTTAVGAASGASEGQVDESSVNSMYKNYDAVLAGGILMGIGVPCQIACIPCLKIGYRKMNKSANIYNIECAKVKTQAQPYWSIQSSNNGLGLAFNF